jgi:hypothetical protein
VVLAGIAAVLSYKHMYELVRRYGETSWTATLLPVSVDGMIAASSMTLLADSRRGRRSGILPWALLVIGSAASLAANVAVAEPSAVGRLIAAWPSAALIGSYELLMSQVRHAAERKIPVVSDVSQTAATDPTAPASDGASRGAQAEAAHIPGPDAGEVDLPVQHSGLPGPPGPPRRRSASVLQREAWRWALANRTPTGELPSGKAIAERFGRRERWGRLVKAAGGSGQLEPLTG